MPAALLLERHPAWSVADLKAALIGSGSSGAGRRPDRRAHPRRRRRSRIPHARTSRSFSRRPPRSRSASFSLAITTTARVDLADAGGGAGVVGRRGRDDRCSRPGPVSCSPPIITVPGVLELAPTIAADAAEGDLTGLRAPDARRRRAPHPVLAPRRSPRARLGHGRHCSARPGSMSATPVASRRSPRGTDTRTSRRAAPCPRVLQGPEQVFRVTLTKPAANFGVVITRRGQGARVEPRVVSAGDENRLTGYAALPINLNPYLAEFGRPGPRSRRRAAPRRQLRRRLRQPHACRGRQLSRSASGSMTRGRRPRRSRRCASSAGHPSSSGRRFGLRRRPDDVKATIDGVKRFRPTRRGHDPRPDHRDPARQPPTPAPGVRLPGVAQHGERAADPAEHAGADEDRS